MVLQGRAAAAALALSAMRAAATVFTIAFGGGTWDATLAQRVQHDMPKCQCLQKVHPFTVGRGVLQRVSLVFLPCTRWMWRRGMGRGFVMGSPSLAAPRPCAF